MPSNARRRPIDPRLERTRQRDRAIARLSKLTTATAVAGAFATFGFGTLAAVTFHGATATPADQAVQEETSNDQVAEQDESTGSDESTGTRETGAQAQATPPTTTTRRYTTVQPPTQTTRRSRVSTGGSG